MKDLDTPPEVTALEPQLVKGRESVVQAYKISAT
jgi:hypothetical protein